MAEYVKVTVRVRPFVRDELRSLRRATGAELKRPLPSQDDIVAALIHAATAAKTASALRAYWPAGRPWEDEDDPTATDDGALG